METIREVYRRDAVTFTVSGEELVKHFQARVEYHVKKHGFYAAEVERLRKEGSDAKIQAEATYSNRRVESAADSFEEYAKGHFDKVRMFKFFADHTDKREAFKIGREELAALEFFARE